MLQALIHLIYLLKRFYCLESWIWQKNINKLVNVPTSFNNLKTKVDGVDVGKLKIVLVGFKKLSDTVDNQVVKNSRH